MRAFPFPQELIDHTIDVVADSDSDTTHSDLLACSLVAKNWCARAQAKHFETVAPSSLEAAQNLYTTLANSPLLAKYIKHLGLHLASSDLARGDTTVLLHLLDTVHHIKSLSFWIYMGSGSAHSHLFPAPLTVPVTNIISTCGVDSSSSV